MSALITSNTTDFTHDKFETDPSLLEKLSCNIPYCGTIPRNAKSFNCCKKKLICHNCLVDSLAQKKACPFCRTPQTQAFPNEFAQDMIDELDAKCSFVDCEHKAKLTNMIHHEKNHCEFRDVPCEYCKEPVVFNKLAEHKEICELRPMPCEHCPLKFQPATMARHLDTTCEGVMRPCPDGCGKMLSFPMFPSHAAVCIEHKVPCSWADHGCRDLVPRKNIATHETDIKHHITQAVAHATSAIRPSHTSIRMIAWPPSYEVLMSLTGEYFVPQHLHALKVTSSLYKRNAQGQILPNSCNVKHPGCTGHIERIPGIPVQDRFGKYLLFGARCECCDFDACIQCLIAMQTLPTLEQLRAMEQKYKGVSSSTTESLIQLGNENSDMSRVITTIEGQVNSLIRENTELRSSAQRYAAQTEQYEATRLRLSRVEAELIRQLTKITDLNDLVEQRLQRFQSPENVD